MVVLAGGEDWSIIFFLEIIVILGCRMYSTWNFCWSEGVDGGSGRMKWGKISIRGLRKCQWRGVQKLHVVIALFVADWVACKNLQAVGCTGWKRMEVKESCYVVESKWTRIGKKCAMDRKRGRSGRSALLWFSLVKVKGMNGGRR